MKNPENRNFDPHQYNAMFLYAIASLRYRTELAFIALGGTGNNGLDRFLSVHAIDIKKTLIELEGANKQIEMMIELSALAPNFLIEQTLHADLMIENGQKVREAYYAGDIDAMYAILSNFQSSNYPEEAKKAKSYLIEHRSAYLYSKISNLVNDNKKQFIIISMANLYGENGILKMLERDGYSIQQLVK